MGLSPQPGVPLKDQEWREEVAGGGGQREGCPLLTQKQQLKMKSRYLRQTVPHVVFSLNSPILGLRGGGEGQ